MRTTRVAIIGAGPAGLVTLKTLLEASTSDHIIEARVFEAEDEIGGTFRYRSYENAELVSSKQLTAFSDHRFPDTFGDHVSLPEYCAYLRSYVDRFALGPYISLGCRVINVSPLTAEPSKFVHRVRCQEQGSENPPTDFDCTHLAICTGLHVQPSVPHINGIENFRGKSMHSSAYKTRSQLDGHDVLILGCGETAMDIGYEAIKAPTNSVTMSFRTGFLSFPKVLNRFRVFGKKFGGSLPIDGLITNLFETSYVHHTIRQWRLRSLISDVVIKKVMWFLTGSQEGCNQYVGALPNEILGRSYVFLNKSHKAMPYLNRPYKQRQALLRLMGNEYIDPPEDANSSRWIDTCTFPTHFDATGRVHFEVSERKDFLRYKMQGQECRPSLLVYATGYKQDFTWLDSSYPTSGQANVRNIIKAERPDIAFIGFVRPGVGAIPPISEQQAMWWAALLMEKMDVPGTAGHYRLLAKSGARIEYGVDYSTYMSVLAKDFGGAPSLRELWQVHGLKIMLIYCFGASFVSFYRLTGPFASPTAATVASTELLDTILRRGITGNFFFGVVPMMFYGLLNFMAYILEQLRMLPAEQPVAGVDISLRR